MGSIYRAVLELRSRCHLDFKGKEEEAYLRGFEEGRREANYEVVQRLITYFEEDKDETK